MTVTFECGVPPPRDGFILTRTIHGSRPTGRLHPPRLAWPREIEWRGLRRLQLAAKHGQTWGMLFRPDEVACDPSPAALRLKVEAVEEKTLVTILKRRGGWPTGPIQLNTDSCS